MLPRIALFELRYLLRNPLLWVTAAVTFALFFVSTSTGALELGSEGGLLANAAYATLRDYLMVSVVFMFVTTSFVANAVLRDDETGFGPIVRSTGITRFEYVIGRFLGAFAVAALCMLLVPLGLVLGSWMPWADPAQFGPNRLVDHLYAYFVLALPNIFTHSAVLFALATLTRSMMASYLGVIGFMSGFLFLEGAFRGRPGLETIVAMIEPFGARALADATRYWTIAERDVMLPDLAGTLLLNRLLWIAVALLCLALAYATFRPGEPGMSRRERRRQELAERGASPPPHFVAGAPAAPPIAAAGHLGLALLWMRTRFEVKQVVLSPAFVVLMAWGLYTTFFVLITQRDPDGRPSYPTTLSLIPELEEAFALIPLIIAIYHAGELVWRERDRRVHELVDATPMPNWAYVVPKTLAMAVVLMAALLTTIAAAVVVQLALGYSDLEPGKYLLWYLLPGTWDVLLIAALAVFVQALAPHKTVGWGVMVLLLGWQLLNPGVDHDLVTYGATPRTPLSDMNGAGDFWIGSWTFRAYWGAIAVLLLVAAHLLWRRGAEIRLRPRLAHARRRLAGAPGLVACAASLAAVTTGAYAYYNISVLNHARSWSAVVEDMVDLERRYMQYHDLPQPAIVDMVLDVALYPGERRAETSGRFLLRNLTAQPIPEVHLRVLDRDLELVSAAITGAQSILDDTRHGYRIYRLDTPMRPGEERVLTFTSRRWIRGFRGGHPETRLVENGTFLGEFQLSPRIGMNRAGTLEDPALRRKYGLPAAPPPAQLADAAAAMKPSFGRGWATSDITVSTSADQTPLAPGDRVSDVTHEGRRTARFVSKVPVRSRFAVLSARYSERHRMHRGVDLAVYHHPAHGWNVDRMLDAMAAALDYYQANFGPYQFDHLRIAEFPGYHSLAQAFAGTIPFAETVGFVADYGAPDTIDQVTHITAHEVAHQWWAQQLAAADVEGQDVLSETLAQYSAQMVVKQLRGEEHIRRYLRFELDRYLEGRAYASKDEPTLARVRGEDHVAYRKGALAMYLLQKRIGEDAVNRALRGLLRQYRFGGPPYARTLDLIAALRAEATTDEAQALITDLFERVTLHDFEVREPTAVQRADGKWDVSVPVAARKLQADGHGEETETPFTERIEVGLFTAEPGRDVFDARHVLLLERRPIRSGHQVLQFVTDTRPTHAGVDPYNFHIDRNAGDNVAPVK